MMMMIPILTPHKRLIISCTSLHRQGRNAPRTCAEALWFFRVCLSFLCSTRHSALTPAPE